MKNVLKFNLNDYIYVKIYPKGYQKMADNYNRIIKDMPNIQKKTAADYAKKADKNGYTKIQAWVFMEEFGDVTHLGMNSYHSTDILIESDFLTEYNLQQ